MKMVTFSFLIHAEEADIEALQIVISDGVYEYARKREDAEKYAKERMPVGYDADDLKRRTDEIERKVRAAHSLGSSVLKSVEDYPVK